MKQDIGLEEVAGRLVRAMRLDSVMRDGDRAQLKAKVLWPHYLHDRGDLNAQAENHVYLRGLELDAARRRGWDTREARNDYLEVMGWLTEMLRLMSPDLTEQEKAEARSMRARGVPYRQIARRLGVSARSVGILLGIKRGRDVRERGLSEVEFARLVALDQDWETIAEKDGGRPDSAKARWAGIVQVACDIANGRVGLLAGALRGETAGLEMEEA